MKISDNIAENMMIYKKTHLAFLTICYTVTGVWQRLDIKLLVYNESQCHLSITKQNLFWQYF